MQYIYINQGRRYGKTAMMNAIKSIMIDAELIRLNNHMVKMYVISITKSTLSKGVKLKFACIDYLKHPELKKIDEEIQVRRAQIMKQFGL